MTYTAVETSVHAGQPVELYRFSQGARKWLYASTDGSFVHASEIYEYYPLRRGSIRQTQELAKAGVEINAPRDLPFVTSRLANPMQGVVQLSIYRFHRGDAEVKTIWRGRVEGIRFEGSEAIIGGIPLGSALRRIGLKRPAQRQCPYALYDAFCRVNPADFDLTGTLSGYTGAVVSAAGFASRADGWWVGGMIVFADERRFIVAHTGDEITLSSPVPGLAINAAFTVYAGCDYTAETCDARFGNLLNHGGVPGFPVKNPFTGDSPN